MTISKKYPNYYPACCLPKNSIEANGSVFRIVENESLTDNDFLSHYELGTATTADLCGRCGVSVFNSFQNASHRQRLTPRLGKAIAEGNLVPSTGNMLLTNENSGHIEWWSFDGIERKLYFGQPRLCA